ncbi:MAG TPA: protein translocase subunit SecF [Chloroflexia bacterium]|nr:protein translocase subunit SecF [Chloroflexia bacterium]
MINLVDKRILFLIISTIIILPGVIAIIMGGLRPGIDFTGGTRLTVIPKTQEAFNTETFKAALAEAGYDNAVVKAGTLGEGDVVTNTITMDIPGVAELPDAQREQARSRIAEVLIGRDLVAGSQITQTVATSGAIATQTPGATGTITATATTTDTTPTAVPATTEQVSRWRIDPAVVVDDITVGPTVGRELIWRAFGAVGLASLAILIYLTIVFRKVPNAIRYGVCAIFALIHDVLVVLGVFAILGLLLDTEVDALFITAMLTIIGFSVHDTIVVFDRVRENLGKRRFERFEEVVNYSLVQTLARSINTSITVVLTLFALYLFGGASIHNFVLALLIGIISGTYSSIFNASMLLVIWENGEWGRLFGRGRRPEAPAQARPAAR